MSASSEKEARERRAAARRATWDIGEVAQLGDPRPGLYEGLSVEERLRAMTALCEAQWRASGGVIREIPRSEWPGEVFAIEVRDGSGESSR